MCQFFGVGLKTAIAVFRRGLKTAVRFLGLILKTALRFLSQILKTAIAVFLCGFLRIAVFWRGTERSLTTVDLLTLASDYLGSPIFGTFVPHTHTQNQKIKGVQSHGPFGSILFVLTAALPVTRVEAIIG